jgi:hypothetical protein
MKAIENPKSDDSSAFKKYIFQKYIGIWLKLENYDFEGANILKIVLLVLNHFAAMSPPRI